MYTENDEHSPKYVKKSQRKPPKRSNHKHEYEDIALRCKAITNNYWKTIAKRCKICGKIYDVKLFLRADQEEYLNSLPVYETEADVFSVKYV